MHNVTSLAHSSPYALPLTEERSTSGEVNPWFALKVRARGEAVVDAALRRRNYPTFLPTYVDCRQYSDRVRKIDSALFQGYLFCRLNPDHRLPMLSTPGVYDIVRLGVTPAPVDEAEIAAIRKFINSGVPAIPWPHLVAGDRVRVEFGSFTGVEGLLVSQKGADRLVLSISLLQRAVSVEIDRTWVRPL